MSPHHGICTYVVVKARFGETESSIEYLSLNLGNMYIACFYEYMSQEPEIGDAHGVTPKMLQDMICFSSYLAEETST
jgi:hypothetical protein